jgi:pyrimidine oxygenase
VKFGIFLPNGRNGYILSRATSQFDPTFAHNRDISVAAEENGFDMVLSMMKYRGFGGETGYWDACLETFTLMAGLAVATKRIELFPSVTLLANHPAVVARIVATIDDISGGRCGLNVVTGWNKPEYTQMNLWRGDEYYNRRYELAKDYVRALKALWSEGQATYRSENFDLEDCACFPQPKHPIRIVAAGQSPAGMEFVAEMGDRNFVSASGARLAEVVRTLKSSAAKHGRDVGTYACMQIVTADTDAAAQEIVDRIVAEADRGAIANMLASANLDTNRGGSSEHMRTGLARAPEEGNMAFMSIPVIYGSHRRVAEKLDQLAEETGIDGVMCSFPDYVPGIRALGEKVIPHLSAAMAEAR